MTDTITAIATATGKGSVGIVRISGPEAKIIGESICKQELKPRHATFTAFYNVNKNDEQSQLDEGIAIYFKAPASFTGEDIVEFQAHGGIFLLDLILKQTITLGARLARPGEFSERAFLNDKIDLVQAEAIADIIESQSENALRSSLVSLNGEFSKKIDSLVTKTTELRVYVEAAIDFPDEDIDFVSDQHIATSLNNLIQEVENILDQAKTGAILSEGLNVVILGKPNAGKSSLLNALAQDDIAIVTHQEGTTRDILKQQIILNGISLNLIDTAGLRKSNDLIEQEGIKRISKVAKSADVVLYLRDASLETDVINKSSIKSLVKEHEIQLAKNAYIIVLNNKIDLTDNKSSQQEIDELPVLSISAKQKTGLDLLGNLIETHYGINNDNQNVFTARTRHINHLETALDFLYHGKKQLNNLQAGELLAEDLRQTQNNLGEITGKISSDELLGEIFSSFCIGK